MVRIKNLFCIFIHALCLFVDFSFWYVHVSFRDKWSRNRYRSFKACLCVYVCLVHGSLKPALPGGGCFHRRKGPVQSIVYIGYLWTDCWSGWNWREEEESSFLSTSVLIPPRRPSHHCRHRVKQVANNNKGNALKAGIVDCHCRGSFKKIYHASLISTYPICFVLYVRCFSRLFRPVRFRSDRSDDSLAV